MCGYTESHQGSYVYYKDPKMADIINKVKTLSINSDQLSKITKSIYVIFEEESH